MTGFDSEEETVGALEGKAPDADAAGSDAVAAPDFGPEKIGREPFCLV